MSISRTTRGAVLLAMSLESPQNALEDVVGVVGDRRAINATGALYLASNQRGGGKWCIRRAANLFAAAERAIVLAFGHAVGRVIPRWVSAIS
jgi:hypothetical protein